MAVSIRRTHCHRPWLAPRFICAFSLLALLTLSAHAVQPNACDQAAGHPSDPNKVGPGVATAQVVTHVAIPACRDALKQDPGNPRLQYQLGRALYYWAEANDGDSSEAFTYLERASQQQYTQAMFVLGLLRKYRGQVCQGRALIKSAADRGLKSGRLTYVSDILAGTYQDCQKRIASDAELWAYAEAASAQADGYYENMLVANLQRQLKAKMNK